MKEYWEPSSVGVVALERLKQHLAEAIEGVERDSPWFMACLQAGASDQADSWRELIGLIKAAREDIAKRDRLIVRLRPSTQSALPAQDQIRILHEIIQHLKSPKRFKKLTWVLHPECNRLTQDTRTDLGELQEMEHVNAVLQ